MKNVLIVDSDLGFIFWLAEVLVEANYQPWPACSTLEAMSLAGRRRLNSIDLLIINPSLRGATDLMNSLRHTQPDLKVLAVDPLHDRQVRGVNAWRARPNPSDHSAKQKWAREIDRILSVHHRAA